jgi:O-Antigen ligase
MDATERIERQGGVALGYPRPALTETLRRHGPAVAGYALPFLLVVYLALKGGGYDAILRGEVGVAVWWLVLVGAAVGVLPAGRVSRAGWAVLVLLALLAVWTTLGVGWSESSERSLAEAGRVATYLGVLALALSAQGSEGIRRTTYAVGAAVGLIGALALLSRLHSDWFGAVEPVAALGEEGRRLGYPLNYWNGLAALIAIGMPLLVWIASSARYVVTRALAAAALPALSAALYFTLSRGGMVELVVALGVLVALHPRRVELLPTLLVGGAGSALAVVAASQREALANGAQGPLASSQASEMLALAIIICAGVGLSHVAITLAQRHRLVRVPLPSGRRTAQFAAGAAVLVLVAAVAAGAPGKIADGWEEFKDPVGPSETAERIESASGNGRYQYWSSMVDAAASEPLTGIGPGTFELWWAREGTRTGFVRDAHSLYFEALGELGVPGLLLVLGLIGAVLGCGAARALRASDRARRGAYAAATAGCAAFAVAAALDWAWELTVLPVAFLLLAAAVTSVEPPAPRTRDGDRRGLQRSALAALSVAAVVVIALPLGVTSLVRESQAAVNADDLGGALDEARSAGSIQRSAATPPLQEALVLELAGDLDAAAAEARDATEAEPTNWRTWLVLSRIEARRGEVPASIDAYRRARSLNPRSPLFAP